MAASKRYGSFWPVTVSPPGPPFDSATATATQAAIDSAASAPTSDAAAFSTISAGATSINSSLSTIETNLGTGSSLTGGSKQRTATVAADSTIVKGDIDTAAAAIDSGLTSNDMTVQAAGISSAATSINTNLNTLAVWIRGTAATGASKQRSATTAGLITGKAATVVQSTIAGLMAITGEFEGQRGIVSASGFAFRWMATTRNGIAIGWIDESIYATFTHLGVMVGTESTSAEWVANGFTADNGGTQTYSSTGGYARITASSTTANYGQQYIDGTSFTSSTNWYWRGFVESSISGTSANVLFGALYDGAKIARIGRFVAGTTYLENFGATTVNRPTDNSCAAGTFMRIIVRGAAATGWVEVYLDDDPKPYLSNLRVNGGATAAKFGNGLYVLSGTSGTTYGGVKQLACGTFT